MGLFMISMTQKRTKTTKKGNICFKSRWNGYHSALCCEPVQDRTPAQNPQKICLQNILVPVPVSAPVPVSVPVTVQVPEPVSIPVPVSILVPVSTTVPLSAPVTAQVLETGIDTSTNIDTCTGISDSTVIGTSNGIGTGFLTIFSLQIYSLRSHSKLIRCLMLHALTTL